MIKLANAKLGYVLAGTDALGTNFSITLSHDDMLGLSRTAQSIEASSIERLKPSAGSGSGLTPVVATPVQSGSLTADPVSGNVLMTLRQETGREHIYSLSPSNARILAAALPQWAEKAEQAISNKTQH